MRERLMVILETLQPFAPWHLESLSNACRLYKEILAGSSQTVLNSTDLEFLKNNLCTIEAKIEDAEARKAPEPYNFAVTLLRYDIELLIQRA